MRFDNFTPAERRVLLHSIEDEILSLDVRTASPIEPGVWRESNELCRASLRVDRDHLKSLLAELRPLVIADLN